MMKLNLITFASSLATRESIFTDHHELLDAIKEKYDVQYIFPEELDKPLPEGATMVLVGSGGVEEMVKAHIDRLPTYVVLIADGLKNSLAASLEILSWMRQNDRHGRVLHGPTGFIMQGILDYAMAHDAIDWLSGKRVGVIGKPSDGSSPAMWTMLRFMSAGAWRWLTFHLTRLLRAMRPSGTMRSRKSPITSSTILVMSRSLRVKRSSRPCASTAR